MTYSHLYMYFAHPIDFLPYQFWFLFDVIPGVDCYLRHFGTIDK